MYIDYSTWETFDYKVSSLNLDVNNPRIRYKTTSLNQEQILKLLIKDEKVYELAKKISEEGYFVGEEPIICIEKNKKVVLEGNRRVAALKLLQNPEKYVSKIRANILLQNIQKNSFPVDRKIKCHLSPNRLLANPIIYERHNGISLHKWRTGNQYAFVAEMYYEDGLVIEDICDILNESKSNILRPLKAYNLFFEGKEILENEGIPIYITDFEITNLERFYSFEPARNFIGIEFSNENGDLIITLPREEFEKRLSYVFKTLIDSERFSRIFNTEEDKVSFIETLKKNPEFDLTVTSKGAITKSKSSEKRSNLEEKKNNVTSRRNNKNRNGVFNNVIIPRDKEIVFNNDKLDELFSELKYLPIDRKYSFSLLLRSYLEQSLYFYISKQNLFDKLDDKIAKEHIENGKKKVKTLIDHIKTTYSVDKEINVDNLMNILKFNNTGKEFSNTSLKIMLDFVIKEELSKTLDTITYKNLKHYIERIKEGLDLAAHNLVTIIDSEHNKRAWQHLEPLFDFLSNELNKE